MLIRVCCAVATLIAATAAGGQEPERCRQDLRGVDASFRETMARLDAAKAGTPPEQCAAWRHHIQVMRAGVAVFERCMAGHALRENAGQLLDSIHDFEELVKAKCP